MACSSLAVWHGKAAVFLIISVIYYSRSASLCERRLQIPNFPLLFCLQTLVFSPHTLATCCPTLASISSSFKTEAKVHIRREIKPSRFRRNSIYRRPRSTVPELNVPTHVCLLTGRRGHDMVKRSFRLWLRTLLPLSGVEARVFDCAQPLMPVSYFCD